MFSLRFRANFVPIAPQLEARASLRAKREAKRRIESGNWADNYFCLHEGALAAITGAIWPPGCSLAACQWAGGPTGGGQAARPQLRANSVTVCLRCSSPAGQAISIRPRQSTGKPASQPARYMLAEFRSR